jgi:hypothetical protein
MSYYQEGYGDELTEVLKCSKLYRGLSVQAGLVRVLAGLVQTQGQNLSVPTGLVRASNRTSLC